MKKYFPACGSEIHLVQYGTPKNYVVKARNAILIDDEFENGIRWMMHGGEWIDPNEQKLKPLCGLWWEFNSHLILYYLSKIDK